MRVPLYNGTHTPSTSAPLPPGRSAPTPVNSRLLPERPQRPLLHCLRSTPRASPTSTHTTRTTPSSTTVRMHIQSLVTVGISKAPDFSHTKRVELPTRDATEACWREGHLALSLQRHGQSVTTQRHGVGTDNVRTQLTGHQRALSQLVRNNKETVRRSPCVYHALSTTGENGQGKQKILDSHSLANCPPRQSLSKGFRL